MGTKALWCVLLGPTWYTCVLVQLFNNLQIIARIYVYYMFYVYWKEEEWSQ